jgi:nucleoid-associated protein YgaU
MCPYLLSEDGTWRAARVAREHRCTAVEPQASLPGHTQRALCLVEEHVRCPAFAAAQRQRGTELAAAGISSEWLDARVARTAPSTVPVALDRPRSVVGVRLDGRRARRVGQAGLVGLMVAAGAALVLARFSPAAPTASQLPASTVAAVIVPGPTSVPAVTTPMPAVTPSQAPSRRPPASPTAAVVESYTVRSGDTLSEIAERYGTTVEELQRVNSLGTSTLLRIGQELKLP